MPMYQVKPIVDGHIEIDLPTCMYSYQIHAQHGNSFTAEHALQVTVNRFNLGRYTFECIYLTGFGSWRFYVIFRGSETLVLTALHLRIGMCCSVAMLAC